MLRTLTILIATLLAAVALKRMLTALAGAQARATVTPPPAPPAVTRLRQDPRTGIYYPES